MRIFGVGELCPNTCILCSLENVAFTEFTNVTSFNSSEIYIELTEQVSSIVPFQRFKHERNLSVNFFGTKVEGRVQGVDIQDVMKGNYILN